MQSTPSIGSPGHMHGWFCLFDKVGAEAFNAADEQLVTLLTTLLSRVYENRQLYADAQRRSEELGQEVAEGKQAQEALRQSEERFAKAFQASPDVLFITRQADGKILEVNDSWETVTGYSLDEAIGRTIVELKLLDAATRQQGLAQLRERGSVREAGLELRHKSGEMRQISASVEAMVIGGEVCFLTIIRDITERRRAEETLRKSEDRFSKAFHGSPVPMTIARQADGSYIEVNESFLRLVECGREEVIGHTSLELNLIDAEGRVEIMRQVRQQGAMHNIEVQAKAKSGRRLNLLTSIENIELAGEACTIAIMLDITARKQAEQELKQTMAELTRSNADLEQFAYVASHDLQEPLRAVASMLQLLQQRYAGQLDARADQFINHAVEGAARMQTLIADLLAFSRIATRGRPFQPTDCTTVLAHVRANLTVAIQESGAVITHDPLPTVMADPTQLTQLLQNLIANALKFRRDGSPAIHIRVEHTEAEWLFAVCDNGIGMEAQYFERIFVLFQRLHTRREYAGTGIGLAVCKKIVERHGGRIWVESEPGQGSTFYFTLPDGSHPHSARAIANEKSSD